MSLRTYLVGGAVRDRLMGLGPKDMDYVVVGSTQEEMLAAGFREAGVGFSSYLHPTNGDQYALARRERKSGSGYRGFVIESGPEVTLAEDLYRRDLTINAIAQDPNSGEIIDPHGGRRDIQEGVLRAVNPGAFADDPVRVLRLARFAARYPSLTVDPQTMLCASESVRGGELEREPAERIYEECSLALCGSRSPSRFFEILSDLGALRHILPEVENLKGIEQPKHGHHEGDAFQHTMMVIDSASWREDNHPRIMWAALLHDIGKALTPREEWPAHHGHEKAGEPLVRQALGRLRAPRDVLNFAAVTCRQHMRAHKWCELRAGTILEILEEMSYLREPAAIDDFLDAFDADTRGRAMPVDESDLIARRLFFRSAQAAAASIHARDLLADRALHGREEKPPGPWVGDMIRSARIRAIKSIKKVAIRHV